MTRALHRLRTDSEQNTAFRRGFSGWRISFGGWARAPTTTSAEERCCGEALAGPTADWDSLQLVAPAFHRDQTPMGVYLRHLKAKLGPVAAIAATAHKIAIIFRTMVSKQEYDISL